MNALILSYPPTEAGFEIIPGNEMPAIANNSGSFAAIKTEGRV
jgi:hypothetical protein